MTFCRSTDTTCWSMHSSSSSVLQLLSATLYSSSWSAPGKSLRVTRETGVHWVTSCMTPLFVECWLTAVRWEMVRESRRTFDSNDCTRRLIDLLDRKNTIDCWWCCMPKCLEVHHNRITWLYSQLLMSFEQLLSQGCITPSHQLWVLPKRAQVA